MSHSKDNSCDRAVPYQDVFGGGLDALLGVANGDHWTFCSAHDDSHSSDTARQLKVFLANKMHRGGLCALASDWTDREGSFQFAADHATMTVYSILASGTEMGCFAAVRPSEREEDEMERSVLQLLDRVYELDKADSTKRAAAKAIFIFIERNFAQRDLRALHRLMVRMEIRRMSELSLVGLIRATSRAKNLLPLWGRTLQKTRKALEDRGLDHQGLLMGIRQVG